MQPGQPKRRGAKLVAVGAAVLLLLAAWRSGALAIFGDPERLRQTLLELGPTGYVVYVFAFALLQPLGVPGFAFIVGASYVWSKPVAFGLAMVGALLSCSVGFAFSRFVARDWVEARLPARLRRYDERIATNAFLTAILVRLVFWLNPFSHALFGVSKTRYTPYIVGSAIGLLPSVVTLVWASGAAIDYLRDKPVREWLPFLAATVLLAIAFKGYRIWSERRRGTERG